MRVVEGFQTLFELVITIAVLLDGNNVVPGDSDMRGSFRIIRIHQVGDFGRGLTSQFWNTREFQATTAHWTRLVDSKGVQVDVEMTGIMVGGEARFGVVNNLGMRSDGHVAVLVVLVEPHQVFIVEFHYVVVRSEGGHLDITVDGVPRCGGVRRIRS